MFIAAKISLHRSEARETSKHKTITQIYVLVKRLPGGDTSHSQRLCLVQWFSRQVVHHNCWICRNRFNICLTGKHQLGGAPPQFAQSAHVMVGRNWIADPAVENARSDAISQLKSGLIERGMAHGHAYNEARRRVKEFAEQFYPEESHKVVDGMNLSQWLAARRADPGYNYDTARKQFWMRCKKQSATAMSAAKAAYLERIPQWLADQLASTDPERPEVKRRRVPSQMTAGASAAAVPSTSGRSAAATAAKPRGGRSATAVATAGGSSATLEREDNAEYIAALATHIQSFQPVSGYEDISSAEARSGALHILMLKASTPTQACATCPGLICPTSNGGRHPNV